MHSVIQNTELHSNVFLPDNVSKQELPIKAEDQIKIENPKKVAVAILKQHPLSNPFPLKFNSHAVKAYAKTIEWVQKFKLIPDEKTFKKFLAAQFINLTSGAYPNCTSKRLVPISDWIIFLYLNDDAVEKKDSKSLTALNTRNIKILKEEISLTKTDEPLTCAMHDLMKRIRKIANKEWIRRFLIFVNLHFESTVWEADNREANIKIPDYDIYIEKRLHTGGVYTVLPLIEFAEKLAIPEKIFETYLNDLNRMCNNIICWSNDIKSCPKEFEENFINNLVFVIQRQKNNELKEAIKEAVDLHNQEVNRFEEAKNKLYDKLNLELKPYAKKIRKYVEGMRYWMGSHFDFAQKSARYN